MHKIDQELRPESTLEVHDIVELTAVNPNFDWAKGVPMLTNIYSLKFEFKPVRMIVVDLPQPGGMIAPKQVWYMVYSVTNTGKELVPSFGESTQIQVQQVNRPIRFFPALYMYCPEVGKIFPDQILPAALAKIQEKEDKTRNFHDTVDMLGKEIKPGETVWGVAIWNGLQPQVNEFSIYVEGLTNAYRYSDDGSYKQGDNLLTGRTIVNKSLKIYFSRPGGFEDPNMNPIHYGRIDGPDHEWVFTTRYVGRKSQ